LGPSGTDREKHGVQEQGCEVDVVAIAAPERFEALAQRGADPRGGRLRQLPEPGLLAQRLDVAHRQAAEPFVSKLFPEARSCSGRSRCGRW
jgi:hypothetical protein